LQTIDIRSFVRMALGQMMLIFGHTRIMFSRYRIFLCC
jgi:hypothetical protein